jgi:hypothetical protein
LAGYENVRLKIEKQEYTNNGGDVYTYKTVDIDTYTFRTMSGVRNYRFLFNGIAAKEMGNEIKAYVLADKDGHTYTSEPDIYSIKTYAYACLNSDSPSITESFKKLIVYMLNYGSFAQQYFNYNINNLVNADLTDEHVGLTDERKILAYTLLDDGTYSVSAGEDIYAVTQVKIPSTHNGKAVTQIAANAFKNCDHLKQVIIPEGMKVINSYAFDGCTALNSLVLANSIERFEDYAFANCDFSSVTSLPSSLQYIGAKMLDQATWPTTITIPASVTYIGSSMLGTVKTPYPTIYFESTSGWYMDISDNNELGVYINPSNKRVSAAYIQGLGNTALSSSNYLVNLDQGITLNYNYNTTASPKYITIHYVFEFWDSQGKFNNAHYFVAPSGSFGTASGVRSERLNFSLPASVDTQEYESFLYFWKGFKLIKQ